MWEWLKTSAWPAVLGLVARWNEDEGFVRSAAMAYYAAFSLFPLCLVLLAAFGAASHLSSAVQIGQQELLSAVEQSAGPWIAARLGELLSNVKSKAGVGGPIGFLGLLLAALGMFKQLDHLLDRIWQTRTARPTGLWNNVRYALIERLQAFLMLMFLGVLLATAWIAQIALGAVQSRTAALPWSGYAYGAVHLLITPLVYTVVLTIIYKVLPRAEVSWGEAASGGFAVAIAWSVGQRVLEWLVIGDSYSAYGVVGAFLGVMVWLYYASAALFLGAEFVQLVCRRCPREMRKT